jgi:hypothetical protein
MLWRGSSASHRDCASMSEPLKAVTAALRGMPAWGPDAGRGGDRASGEGNGKVCRFVLSDLTQVLERGKP